jgi:hypothetical protein
MENRINQLINDYNTVVKVIDKDAKDDTSERAYGGIIRATKGKLQEHITEEIVKIAWEELGGDENRLNIDSKKHKIPINIGYVKHKIKDNEIKKYILDNIDDYYYGLSVDKQVYIDDKFVLGIECKAYTENAMLKRILVDFYLLKTRFPNISSYLFQLESQLGGDYSELNEKTFGSHSTYTLLSYFENLELKIVTFIKGERKVDKPIHKYFKPIEKKQLIFAVNLIKEDLKEYL